MAIKTADYESLWKEMYEFVSDMRDSHGTANQRDTCAYILHVMEMMERRPPESQKLQSS